MSDDKPKSLSPVDFDPRNWVACGPQESRTYTFTDPAVQLDGTPDNGLISLGQFPGDLRGSVPEHFLPTLRPILAAFSYQTLTGGAHSVEVALVGRRLPLPVPALVPEPQWRHMIMIHDQTQIAAEFITSLFGFNVPVPVDTEAGNGNPWSLRIRTALKTGVSSVSLNWQWGWLDLSSRTHVGVSG